MIKTDHFLKLKRYPVRRNELLQAYDAADELMVAHAQGLALSGKKILVVNDSFGAISCSLEAFSPDSFTDSYASAKGLELNSEGRLKAITTFLELRGPYDFVFIKIPKNMSFFEDILSNLTQVLKPGGQVICGYRVKHQSNSSFDLLNEIIGPTTTSLAQKKARLIFCGFEKQARNSKFPIEVALDGFSQKFQHESNLFSREKLDIGTRFFLEHLPKGVSGKILDLGCANGVVGVRAKQLNPEARLSFSDESFMAVKSAEINFHRYFTGETAEFNWSHCYESGASNDFDSVLCNPPFHQGHQVGDQIAREMFLRAREVLKVGGRLRIIGNSHLRYQSLLRSFFGNAELIAQNSKFHIIESIRA